MNKRWYLQLGIGFCLLSLLAGCATPPPSKVVILPNKGLKVPAPPPSPAPPPPADTDEFRVDVGRVPETEHPVKGLHDFVMKLNDRIREVTGLPIDLFVGEDGGKWVMTSRAPAVGKAALLDTESGAAMTNFHQLTGLPPKASYFQKLDRPNAYEVLQQPVQFLPVADPTFAAAGLSLPEPNFAFEPLGAVLPDANVTSGDGTYQINNILRIQLSFVPQVGKAVDPSSDRLAMTVTGVMLPDLCGWKGIGECTHPSMPIQNRQVDPIKVIVELEKLVLEKRDEGEEITPAIFDELYERYPYDLDGAMSYHLKAGNRSWHLYATGGGVTPEGGCGCRIDGATAAPGRQIFNVMLALLALVPIVLWRRRHRTVSP